MNVTYDLVEAVREGDVLTLWLVANNARSARDFPLSLRGSQIVDDLADTHEPVGGLVGKQYSEPLTRVLGVPLPHDTPVRFGVRYKGVSPTAKKITSFTLRIDDQKLTYRNMPIVDRAAEAPAPPSTRPEPKSEPEVVGPARVRVVIELGSAQQSETLEGTIGKAQFRWELTAKNPRVEEVLTVPTGQAVAYELKSRTVATLNGQQRVYTGSGSGSFTPTRAETRVIYTRDTTRPTNFGCVLSVAP